ncbi:MAG: NAD(P)/FAD-dependent oxidoreductase [Thermoanaerobaculia bacterium]
MPDTGVAVIGAGAVGLAVAARLASRNPDVLVVDRNPRHGMETSSRNSQVIHAGIYYPLGSLKARLCREGNVRLYALCAAHDIPHRRIGKVITATVPEELPALERILENARSNGVTLEPLSEAQTHDREPRVRSVGALWSESSGVIDPHGLMDHYLHAALASGAIFYSSAALVGIESAPGGYRLTVRRAGALESFTAERVVNAAGLEADTVAAMAGIDVEAAGYRLHYCKGSYFSAAPRRARAVSHLIYPVPAKESLGIHVVFDTGGRMRFGPDAEYLPGRELDYRVDPSRRSAFADAARRLLPEIQDEDLEPDISGIRPKLQAKGEPVRDFVIREERDRGLPGFYDLIGIESPGLTAAPAIAEHVAALIGV